jgi:hypothetical protein
MMQERLWMKRSTLVSDFSSAERKRAGLTSKHDHAQPGEGIIYQMEAQREQLVRASEQVNNF